MLHLISIVLMTEIQLKKKFSDWSHPVLTTTQNDENHRHVAPQNTHIYE